MRRRHPELTRIIAKGINYYAAWLIERAILGRNPFEIVRIAFPLSFKRPDLVALAFTNLLRSRIKGKPPHVPSRRWAELSAPSQLQHSVIGQPKVAR